MASTFTNPTITVTSAADIVDPNDGVITLREAVEQANQQPGFDSISIGTSTPVFLQTIQLTKPLDITDDLSISGVASGKGPLGPRLQGDGTFNLINATDANLSIGNLMLIDGLDGINVKNGNLKVGGTTVIGSRRDAIVVEGTGKDISLTMVRVLGSEANGLRFDVSESKVSMQFSVANMNGANGLNLSGDRNQIQLDSSNDFNYNQGDGIAINGAYNTMSGSFLTALNNVGNGLRLSDGFNNVRFREGLFNYNGADGLNISGVEAIANQLRLENVSFTGNQSDGIDVLAANNTLRLFQVGLNLNGEDGFAIEGSGTSLQIHQSALDGNLGDGLRIDSLASGNLVTIDSASLSQNQRNGIGINSDNNALILANLGINQNGQNGLELQGANNALTIRETGFMGNRSNAIANSGLNNAIAGVNFGTAELTTDVIPLPVMYQSPLAMT